MAEWYVACALLREDRCESQRKMPPGDGVPKHSDRFGSDKANVGFVYG